MKTIGLFETYNFSINIFVQIFELEFLTRTLILFEKKRKHKYYVVIKDLRK